MLDRTHAHSLHVISTIAIETKINKVPTALEFLINVFNITTVLLSVIRSAFLRKKYRIHSNG